MRITLTTHDNALSFLRRAGYGYQKEGNGEIAFVRRVSGSPFPRYHAYVMERAMGQDGKEARSIEINLHVDQKAPTYGRGAAHSGEYDGPLVAQEAARLRALAQIATAQTPEDQRGRSTEEPKKKGFFGRLFG